MKLLTIYDTPDKSADLLYATSFNAPDPVLYIECFGEKYLYVSPLEFDRANSVCSDNINILEIYDKVPTEIIHDFASKRNITEISVPFNFPAGLATELQSKGISITPVNGACFPQRAIKTKGEIAKIANALKIAESAMLKAEKILAESKVDKKNQLIWHGEPLTSERIRRIIDMYIAGQNASSKDTIIACGTQSAEPHNSGSGILKAGQPIIIDIFPRASDGYWGDITRTFVKWKASSKFLKMYQTVKDSAEKAMSKIRPGAIASEIYKIAFDHIKSQGFKTGKMHGKNCGFFHGLGHGVGLEIHEAPALSPKNDKPLKKGNVITVEPGIYYPNFGGIRIEDMLIVKKDSAENLTTYHKNPVIE